MLTHYCGGGDVYNVNMLAHCCGGDLDMDVLKDIMRSASSRACSTSFNLCYSADYCR